MKLIDTLFFVTVVMTACGLTQTRVDTTYLPFADRSPFPQKGMAELSDRVVYPEIAVQGRIRGTVYVTAYVNETGGVDSATVVSGVHPSLDSAAVRAVRSTIFVPALFKGKAVRAFVTIPIRFSVKQ